MHPLNISRPSSSIAAAIPAHHLTSRDEVPSTKSTTLLQLRDLQPSVDNNGPPCMTLIVHAHLRRAIGGPGTSSIAWWSVEERISPSRARARSELERRTHVSLMLMEIGALGPCCGRRRSARLSRSFAIPKTLRRRPCGEDPARCLPTLDAVTHFAIHSAVSSQPSLTRAGASTFASCTDICRSLQGRPVLKRTCCSSSLHPVTRLRRSFAVASAEDRRLKGRSVGEFASAPARWFGALLGRHFWALCGPSSAVRSCSGTESTTIVPLGGLGTVSTTTPIFGGVRKHALVCARYPACRGS
uniref:Uncharacterized protein n=1 Tax=Mycena chlorophos TaxID=658473 RepID=A0ABQ0KVE0_MYCCL|nr:predicted protein [Mycena chlorophos]